MSEPANHRRCPPDYSLILCVVCLVSLGIYMVFDASYAKAGQTAYTGKDLFFYLKRQFVWALLGCLGLWLAIRWPYWHLRRFALPGVFLSIILLALVLVPGVGIEMGGARRWIGRSPLVVQPSEFAKLALVLFLAHLGAAQQHRIRRLKDGLLPRLVILSLLAALIVEEPDLGTAVVLVATGWAMLVASGARPLHLASFGAALVTAACVAIRMKPYRAQRLGAWLDPWGNYHDSGFQVVHSLLAIGSGGLFGVGPGQGLQKFYYLPAEKTDYIFATIGEEFGLFGTLTVLSLFAIFVYRGFLIAHRTRDPFGALLAAGVATMVGSQALLNIAVTTNAVPSTGVPLPFISFGGSSLVITMFTVGILLNVSMYPDAVTQERDESHRVRRRDGRPHLPRPKHRRSPAKARSRGALRWQ